MDHLPKKHKLFKFEREKRNEGFLHVAGLDEVGRGPLAGPVVAAAVILPDGQKIPCVDDSKQLTAQQRVILRDALMALPGIRYAIVEVGPDEIDRINILRATHLAFGLALEKLPETDFALVDGLPVKTLKIPSLAIVKGDAKSASIAAASIIAKVYRDALMDKFAELYPEYGFDENRGYGTAQHLEAIRRSGPCPIHRRTFEPLKSILNPAPAQQELGL